MKIPAEYWEKLKWTVYDWIGAISVKELTTNNVLQRHIEVLCKQLASCSS